MSEVRQRWRLVFGRDEEARYLAHLDAVKLWERALRRGAVPIATTEGFNPRPRLVFAAPLPLGMLAEHELADLFLSERLTLPNLRRRLERSLPLGYRLLELRDEWVGAPALATQLVAADYRLRLLGPSPGDASAAIARVLGARRLDREKRRETKAVAYDLRPLIVDLRLAGDQVGGATESADTAGAGDTAGAAAERPREGGQGAGSGRGTEGVALWMRLRHSQDQGSGRPEEVVAAVAEELPERRGPPEIALPIRERLWLADELTPLP